VFRFIIFAPTIASNLSCYRHKIQILGLYEGSHVKNRDVQNPNEKATPQFDACKLFQKAKEVLGKRKKQERGKKRSRQQQKKQRLFIRVRTRTANKKPYLNQTPLPIIIVAYSQISLGVNSNLFRMWYTMN
jgi:hypothetical protein